MILGIGIFACGTLANIKDIPPPDERCWKSVAVPLGDWTVIPGQVTCYLIPVSLPAPTPP